MYSTLHISSVDKQQTNAVADYHDLLLSTSSLLSRVNTQCKEETVALRNEKDASTETVKQIATNP